MSGVGPVDVLNFRAQMRTKGGLELASLYSSSTELIGSFDLMFLYNVGH